MLRMAPFCDTVFIAGRPPVDSVVVDTGELRARSYVEYGWDEFLRSALEWRWDFCVFILVLTSNLVLHSLCFSKDVVSSEKQKMSYRKAVLVDSET